MTWSYSNWWAVWMQLEPISAHKTERIGLFFICKYDTLKSNPTLFVCQLVQKKNLIKIHCMWKSDYCEPSCKSVFVMNHSRHFFFSFPPTKEWFCCEVQIQVLISRTLTSPPNWKLPKAGTTQARKVNWETSRGVLGSSFPPHDDLLFSHMVSIEDHPDLVWGSWEGKERLVFALTASVWKLCSWSSTHKYGSNLKPRLEQLTGGHRVEWWLWA